MTPNDRLQSNKPADHQRRPEYVRDDVWIRDFLRRGEIAHIASLQDGQPWVTPSTYYFDEPGHRLIFHSNITGRLRFNIEHNPRASAEVSEMGKPLPSNAALEFSLQYRSVMVFGKAQLITNPGEQTDMLHQLIAKYFGQMELGKDYRPVTEKELKRVSVYGLKIEAWSGKENWKERADQIDEWPALDPRWLGMEWRQREGGR
jgi:hypothetical protein